MINKSQRLLKKFNKSRCSLKTRRAKVNNLKTRLSNKSGKTKSKFKKQQGGNKYDKEITLIFKNDSRYNDVDIGPLTPLQVIKLADGLKMNTNVVNLTLHGEINPDGASALAEALAINTHIKNLMLYGCNFNDLGNAVKDNYSINSIEIRNSNIDFTQLFTILNESNNVVTEIFIINCVIGDVAIEMLSEILKQNKHIDSLSLIQCSISLDGFKSLANAIKHNHTLKKLHLGSNNAGLIGQQAIVDALQQNHNITNLSFHRNEIPDELEVKIDKILSRNKKQNWTEKNHLGFPNTAHSAVMTTQMSALRRANQGSLPQLGTLWNDEIFPYFTRTDWKS